MTNLVANLENFMVQASCQYYRLVILVGIPSSGKTDILQLLADKVGCRVVNVNFELSKRMLELTRSQRSRQVERILKDVIAEDPSNVVLLDNLEILFDNSLEVDPLRLLQASSRNRTIVASWNGRFESGALSYAEPGHPEYVQYKDSDVLAATIVESTMLSRGSC
jgi:hypothetical protein